MCPYCAGTGWELVTENGKEYGRKCRCGILDRQAAERKLAFASIPKEFEGLSVENFRTDLYTTEKDQELASLAKTIAERYVNQFDTMAAGGKGLYFYSSTKGSGKTRLAVSIANDIMRKQDIPAKFTTGIQILDRIKATWGGDRKNEETEAELIRDIVSVPLLVVDDIGVEGVKDWVNERFYNILNGRMIEKRVTIFTSNCWIKALNFDDRIINRILRMALPVAFPDESIREKLADKENSEILDRLLGK